MVTKIIRVENCFSCPFCHIKSMRREPDKTGFKEIAYCDHLHFCEDEGSHLSCDKILLETTEHFGDIFKMLKGFPEWCPLEELKPRIRTQRIATPKFIED